MRLSYKVGGEGFANLMDEEVLERLASHLEELTPDE